MPYNPNRLNVLDTTSEVIDIYQYLATEKNIDLKVDIAPETKVFADADALSAILRNLVDNAIKFTDKGGEVIIVSNRQNGTTTIEVKDSGIGIPPEKVKTIFKLNKKYRSSGTAGERGSGLGLHLVRDLVKQNKGKILVSPRPKQGTCFKVKLPSAY